MTLRSESVIVWFDMTTTKLYNQISFPENSKQVASTSTYQMYSWRDSFKMDTVVFQHDNAPPQFAHIFCDFLNGTFPGRWIGRWLARLQVSRLPDLRFPLLFMRVNQIQGVHSKSDYARGTWEPSNEDFFIQENLVALISRYRLRDR